MVIIKRSSKNNQPNRAGLNFIFKMLIFSMIISSSLFYDFQGFGDIKKAKAWVGGPLIIDHTSTNITAIPQAAITQAKSNLHIVYGHTSHGSQLIDGMNGLITFANNGGKGLSLPQNIFSWNNGGTGGALDLHDGGVGGDVGYYPDWVNSTRSYLGTPNPTTGRGTGANSDVNVVIWSWCGQASGYTAQQMIDNYLAPMSQLELDYPGVTFVYMTGHLDGTGLTGNLHQRNEQIRAYCRANNKVLYDFNDIEMYDPDGTYYGNRYATDGCNYDYNNSGGTSQTGDPATPTSGDRNWAIDWQNSHTQNVDWYSCGSAHTQPLNANQKAYAAWHLWARLGGWSGTSDTQAPSVPTNLSGTATTSSAIRLNWTASTDNVGVAGYRIYRNGAQIATTTTISYSNTGLNPATQYSYTVSAFDAARNFSAQTLAVSVATTQSIPIINNISGIAAHGNSIIVYGSGFGIKSVATPNLWDTADNQTLYNSLANGASIPTGGQYPYDDSGAAANTHSTLCTIANEQRNSRSNRNYKTSNIEKNTLSRIWHEVSGSRLYISWWFKADTNLSLGDHSSKYLRVSTADDDFSQHTFAWTQNQDYIYDTGSSCNYGGNKPSFCADFWSGYAPQVNQWTFFEALFDTEHYTYTLKANNQLISQQDYSPGTTKFAAMWIIGFDGGGNNPPNINSWMDDVYIDGTEQRVVLGNASTYNSSTHLELQPPASWSDNQLSFNLNQGSFNNGDLVYLFVVDSNGSISSGYPITISSASIPDTVAPSAPTNLSGTATTSSAIRLNWTASTDNVSVTGYRVYRNGTQIATTTTNSYSNAGLTPATQYSYTVSAFDAARNFSSQSGSVNITTQSVSLIPAISSVSGSVSDNQTIVISGNGFGSKTTAKPILWADFSSGVNPSSLGQRTSWDDIQNLVSTTTLPAGAGTNNGVVGTWNTASGDPHYNPSFSFGVNKNYWTKVYVYAKRYYDFDTTTNQKFFRINPNPVINSNDPVGAYHKGLWTTFLNEGDDDNPDRFCETATCLNGYTKNQWMREEFIWQYSGGSGLNANGSQGAGSGIIDYTRDGVRIHHQENINNGANTQDDLRMLDNFTPDNIPTDTPANGSHVFMSDMYVDDTYSRVMIGNAPTLASSTHREILIPASWSNTSVSAVVNQGTFVSGNAAYLFVVNASNTPSIGYLVTIGSSSTDLTPPTGSVSINSGASYAKSSSTLLSLIASDISGVTQMKLSNISTNFASLAALPFSSTYSWTLLGVDGIKTVYAWFKDTLGNWNSSPYSSSITLDTSSPGINSVSVSNITNNSATINYVNDEATIGYVNYGLSVSYTASTTRESVYLGNHAINLTNLSASTTYDYQIVVFDRAGNQSLSISRQFTTIDSHTPDVVAPGKITNLLSGSVSQSSVVLTWSAPGDDNNVGFASSYDLKYSTTALANNASRSQVNSWWAAAIDVSGEPTPRQAGTVENLTLAGLSASTRYYVAIRAADEAGNISSTSNVTSFVTSAPVSTPPSSGGGGSSSGGGGTGSTPSSLPSTTVVAPSSFTAIGANGQILLNWQNPNAQDFVKVKIFRKLNISPSSPTDATAVLVYEGTAQQFIDTGLGNSLVYYYALYSYDRNLNPSVARLASAKTDVSKDTVTAPKTETTQTTTEQSQNKTTSSSGRRSLVGVKSAEVDSITKQESQELNADPKLVPLDEATYKIYQKVVSLSERELNKDDKYVIAHFIHYGTPTTIVNGAGERGGSIASFRSAFGKLPKTETDWQDVIKIANGRWPTQKNASAEKKAQSTTFAKVYGRAANMSNTNDNAAVTVMTYGLRPALRNTDSEKNGILAFKYYYKRAPSSAEDWDIVRAIAYSGARR